MESWCKVVTDDWDIEDHFRKLWLAHGGPRDAALFGPLVARRNAREFFFSPGAARIAASLIVQYSGVQCARPKAVGLALLVGDQSALELIAGDS
jgi:hypothetical protein